MKKALILFILLFSISTFAQETKTIKDDAVYSQTEINPEFPGGLKSFILYINQNMQKSGMQTETTIPKTVKAKPKVHAMFIVEKDGSLSDIKILGKIDPNKAVELTKILKNSPKWSPAKQSQTIVRTIQTIQVL